MAENKKDSFTFSDKIKNSKPAFNPFSKRVSSKIGNNGKPKKTLFERTRRDAPFFVAAAAALLMLPFLYKYSGSVEDGEIITPGTDSVFEPDHTRIDPILEDPSAQIAQLSVRDPLSLIKGWGDPEPAPSVGSYDRDGMDDTYTPPARSYRNESPYRQQAPAASRAAFQRQAPAPTKVGKLGSASMNLRGGGGGFGRFGGANLKTAAKASSAAAPKAGVKPVSLQPLRAAGNPSRSYFGQGSAAQARASRDAMGKSNALQALTDAMYDPLKANQAPLGGLGGGDFVGGAGAGKWDPHSEYKGITPWWWDMMKQQEMEKWKWKYFLWRKGLVEPLIKGLADFLVQFGTGVMSCLFTATDDISMGNMGRISTTIPGAPGKCNINDGDQSYTMEAWCAENKDKTAHANHYATTCASEDNFESACLQGLIGGTSVKAGEDNKIDHNTWDDSSSTMNKMSYWGRVRNCFNNAYTGQAKTLFDKNIHTVKEQSDCKQIANHSFILKPHSYFSDNGYDKYYHIVIAKNVKINGKWLCEADKTKGGLRVAGVTQDGNQGSASRKNANYRSRQRSKDTKNNVGDNYKVKGGEKGHKQDKNDMYDYTEFNEEGGVSEYQKFAIEHAENCVIYFAEGRSFDYEEYKALLENAQKAAVTEETGKQLHSGKGNTQNRVWQGDTNKGKGKGVNWGNVDIAAFEGKIIPVAIEGYVMKEDPFPGALGMRKALPMMYKDFIAEYVDRQDGEAAHCDWTEFNIAAHDIINLDYVAATLTYGENVNPDDITVTLDILDENRNKVATGVEVKKVENQNQEITGTRGYVANFTEEQISAMGKHMKPAEGQTELDPAKKLVADWTAKKGEAFSNDQAFYRGAVSASPEVQTTKSNPEVVNTETNVTLLARSLTDIPATWNDRNQVPTVAGNNQKVAKGSVLIESLTERADEGKFSQAFVGSDAAAQYVNGIIGKYNAKVQELAGENASVVKMGMLTHTYPTVPEFVDAMNIAKGLGETEVGKGIVCDMARGIAVVSRDNTPVDLGKGGVMTNTFGAFAIYIGDGYLFPNALTSINDKDITDHRFDCVENGKYQCTPDYSWQNYVNNSTRKPFTVTQTDLAKATKDGNFEGSYPLADLKQTVQGNDSTELRASYVAAYGKVFAGEDTCALEGNMSIDNALEYVKLVAKNGTSFKPKASNKKKGDAQGGTNAGIAGEDGVGDGQNLGSH